jgi:hypothetical protein
VQIGFVLPKRRGRGTDEPVWELFAQISTSANLIVLRRRPPAVSTFFCTLFVKLAQRIENNPINFASPFSANPSFVHVVNNSQGIAL